MEVLEDIYNVVAAVSEYYKVSVASLRMPNPKDFTVKIARKTVIVLLYDKDLSCARMENIAEFLNITKQCAYLHLHEMEEELSKGGWITNSINDIKQLILSKDDNRRMG